MLQHYSLISYSENIQKPIFQKEKKSVPLTFEMWPYLYYLNTDKFMNNSKHPGITAIL